MKIIAFFSFSFLGETGPKQHLSPAAQWNPGKIFYIKKYIKTYYVPAFSVQFVSCFVMLMQFRLQKIVIELFYYDILNFILGNID